MSSGRNIRNTKHGSLLPKPRPANRSVGSKARLTRDPSAARRVPGSGLIPPPPNAR